MKSVIKRQKNLDQLITAVQAREVIWDKQYRGHRNRYKLERYWNEVAAELGTSTILCRKRWKNLKDQCRKEMKKNPYDSEWPHFHKLKFIHHQFLADLDEDNEGDDTLNPEDPDYNLTLSQLQNESENKRTRLGFTTRKKLLSTKKRTLEMDTDKLIELVASKEIIWNRQDKKHHNWYKLDQSWKEIAQELGVTRDEARLKWKYIRDTARKEYRKPDSEWQYLSKLQFLINQFCEYSEVLDEDFDPDFGIGDQSYMLDNNQEGDIDEFDTKPIIMETEFYDDGEEEPKDTEVVDNDKDEDVGFFNSLLPHVKKLGASKKMMLRMRIQELVYNSVYNDS